MTIQGYTILCGYVRLYHIIGYIRLLYIIELYKDIPSYIIIYSAIPYYGAI